MSEIHLDLASGEQSGCGCGTHSAAANAQQPSATGFTTTFQVVGMTCGHCVSAVTGELTDSVPGVSDVRIDLPSGQVILISDHPVTQAAVAAAVDEAGYQLAPGSLH